MAPDLGFRVAVASPPVLSSLFAAAQASNKPQGVPCSARAVRVAHKAADHTVPSMCGSVPSPHRVCADPCPQKLLMVQEPSRHLR